MKTLKELKEKCTLLCEHKQSAFIVKGIINSCSIFNKPNICLLFSDNKGSYYIYKRTIKVEIIKYDNYNYAIEGYIDFITNTCVK